MKKLLCMLLVAVLCLGIVGNVDVQAAKKAKPTQWEEENGRVKDEHEYYIVKAKKPYYVGQQKSSYLKKVSGKYDEILYLGDTYYLGDKAASYKISSKKIAKVVEDELVPLKQGLFTLTSPDGKKTRFAVTTFNDGKDVIKAKNEIEFNEIFDAEEAKKEVKTISDAIDLIRYRGFVYGFSEPYSQWVDSWTWLQSGKSIYDYNIGVCCDISQLMNYLLVEDFEDMGEVLISGSQGHVYNYYFEDGYYYLFDATNIIADRMNGVINSVEFYQQFIYKCKDFDEIKTHVFRNSNINANYLITMTSFMGHDYRAATANNGCFVKSIDEVYNGSVQVEFKMEDVVYDHTVVLWQDPKLDNVKFIRVPNEELPITMRMSRTAVYGNTVKMVKKHK